MPEINNANPLFLHANFAEINWSIPYPHIEEWVAEHPAYRILTIIPDKRFTVTSYDIVLVRRDQ